MLEAVSINGVNATPQGVQSQVDAAVEQAVASESPKQNFFISSRVRVDNELDVAILEYRSRNTGDVVRQFPTEQQIRAFERASELEQQTSETAVATQDFISGGNNTSQQASTNTGSDVGSSGSQQVDIVIPGASSSSASVPASTPVLTTQASTAAPQISGNTVSASLTSGGGSTGSTSTQSVVV